MRKPKARGFTSTKISSMHKKKGVAGNENLGKLMRKHRDLDDVLYSFTANLDMVFEDMDFTIEEFSDMTGTDLEELLDAINVAIKGR